MAAFARESEEEIVLAPVVVLVEVVAVAVLATAELASAVVPFVAEC